MTWIRIGYTRVSTTGQDLAPQGDTLARLGVEPERTYVNHGLAGSKRDRPGLRETLAASRAGDELVLLNVLAMGAEFEADLIKQRTREGLSVARAAGRLKGRGPKLSARQEAHLAKLHRAGDKSPGELAELFGVGRSTVYRAIERAGGDKPGADGTLR